MQKLSTKKDMRENTKTNMERQQEATLKFFKVLADGKEHRIKDFTLNQISLQGFYNILKRFNPLIDKIEVAKSGKGRAPVYYKANPLIVDMMFQLEYLEGSWICVKNYFLKTKDFSKAIEMINDLTNTNLMITLSFIQEGHFIITDPDTLNGILEVFVQSTYKYLIDNLVDFLIKTKIIDNINIADYYRKKMESIKING